MQYMIYAGVIMAVLGLAGLGYCIALARRVKRDADAGVDTKRPYANAGSAQYSCAWHCFYRLGARHRLGC